MVMADVEGIEVVSSLRKRLPDLPVIAISSEALYLDYTATLGGAAVLQKPLDISGLGDAAEAQLASSNLAGFGSGALRRRGLALSGRSILQANCQLCAVPCRSGSFVWRCRGVVQ